MLEINFVYTYCCLFKQTTPLHNLIYCLLEQLKIQTYNL